MFRLMERKDWLSGSEQPFIAIRPEHISFNTVFCKLADLRVGMRFNVYIDDKNYRLGFCFHANENDRNALLLSAQGTSSKNKSLFSSLGELKSLPWASEVRSYPVERRRFEPKLERTEVGKVWTIQLHPTFEIKRAREGKIPSDHIGIYRYRRNGEIVYIGRGDISGRLKEPNRKEWDFDLVEYSQVTDADEQAKWEYFWLERHKEDNDGKLPLYNKISGCKA